MLPLTVGHRSAQPEAAARRIAISGAAGSAVTVKLDSSDAAAKLRSILTSATTPKTIHDYKAAIHALDPLGIHLQGVAARSHALLLPARSHLFLASPGRTSLSAASISSSAAISPKPPTSPAGWRPLFAKK